MPALLIRTFLARRRAWFATALLAAAACGGVSHPADAAPPTDAAVDGTTDAAVDAPPADAAAGPTRLELVGGSARLTGGTYAVELAIGVPSDPTAIGGGTTTIQAGSPVHP